MSQDPHRDDQLRQRLQASDPAASLPATDPDRAARLLEDVMSTELTTENRETGTHGRGPLTWLVAAAAVVLIGGVGLFAVLHHDQATTPDTATPSVTTLAAPGAPAYVAKCAVPTAAILAQQSVAFDGTVTAVADGTVTLDVAHWYAGDPTDQVQVQAPAAELADLLGAVHFQAGNRYLVSADGGQVSLCGLSAPYADDLAALYDQAFS